MEGLADLISSSGHASNGNPLSNGTPQPSSSPILSSVTDGLKRLYTEKLNPLEDTYRFSDFGFPLLTSSDFDSKPMVMLLGQYSTGKTTFIKHLLGCAYLGAHIGPEPTTDRFIVVMSGPDERSIPGNTIAVQADMPFGGLTTFGGSFLSKFECSQMPHPVARLTISEESFEAEARDYTKLIHAYAKKKNLQEAEKILLEMKQKGYVCDQVTLTTLVHMYSKVGNLKLAECAFEEMKLLGEPLDRRAYGSMFLNRVFLKQFAPDTACCWSEFSMACAYYDDSLLPNWKGHS